MSSLLLVGLAPNFWVALAGRILGGALNGNVSRNILEYGLHGLTISADRSHPDRCRRAGQETRTRATRVRCHAFRLVHRYV